MDSTEMDVPEKEFTQAEAESKKGNRVRVTVDGAFGKDDLVKETIGKVVDAKPSASDPNRVIWVVSVQFNNPRKRVDEINKKAYSIPSPK